MDKKEWITCNPNKFPALLIRIRISQPLRGSKLQWPSRIADKQEAIIRSQSSSWAGALVDPSKERAARIHERKRQNEKNIRKLQPSIKVKIQRPPPTFPTFGSIKAESINLHLSTNKRSVTRTWRLIQTHPWWQQWKWRIVYILQHIMNQLHLLSLILRLNWWWRLTLLHQWKTHNKHSTNHQSGTPTDHLPEKRTKKHSPWKIPQPSRRCSTPTHSKSM